MTTLELTDGEMCFVAVAVMAGAAMMNQDASEVAIALHLMRVGRSIGTFTAGDVISIAKKLDVFLASEESRMMLTRWRDINKN